MARINLEKKATLAVKLLPYLKLNKKYSLLGSSQVATSIKNLDQGEYSWAVKKLESLIPETDKYKIAEWCLKKGIKRWI